MSAIPSLGQRLSATTYIANNLSFLTLCHSAKMKPSAASSQPLKSVPETSASSNFQKVFDGRNQPIRGLWRRNDRFYALLSVENIENGVKHVRRVPLEEATTVAEARKPLNRLLTQRDNNDLPTLKRSPKFDDFAESYLNHLAVVVDAKPQ
jgi:hypothetical protein